MRIHIILVIALFLTIKFCNGQVVSVQAGKNWSNLKWKNDTQIPGYTEALNGESLFLNTNFWNKKYFNLSSGLGFMNKTGNNEYKYWREGWGYQTNYSKSNLSYFSINTTIEIKYPIKDRFIPFLSAGPRLDYLISNKNESSRMGKINSTIIGLTMGGGIKYCISKMQIGLQIDYLINFDKIAELPKRPTYTGFYGAAQVYEQVALLKMTIGYRIK